ncbi:hypothetical protein D0865_07051 [Hortaea werneckii]|uniref:Uncharacterized protein n=1 Tax=Hortaea werneckii TaxID=91943 RepID=A0A3M7CEC7_HORWE|nr:hypothetical protein D0865_07051 [Hortaea werneckii]
MGRCSGQVGRECRRSAAGVAPSRCELLNPASALGGACRRGYCCSSISSLDPLPPSLQALCQSAGAAALEKRPDTRRQHRLVIYLRLSAYPFLSSLELDLSTLIALFHPHTPRSNAPAAFDMASSTFRDSMNSLGWSRREQPANTNKQNPLLGSLQKYNPFGGEGNVRLPTAEGEAPGAPLPARSRREEEEGWFALSRWDRILIFGGLNLAAVACFVICFTLLPILSLRPRKFAILGSGRLTIAVWGHAAARCKSSWLMVDGVRALSELLGGDDGPHGVRFEVPS